MVLVVVVVALRSDISSSNNGLYNISSTLWTWLGGTVNNSVNVEMEVFVVVESVAAGDGDDNGGGCNNCSI